MSVFKTNPLSLSSPWIVCIPLSNHTIGISITCLNLSNVSLTNSNHRERITTYNPENSIMSNNHQSAISLGNHIIHITYVVIDNSQKNRIQFQMQGIIFVSKNTH